MVANGAPLCISSTGQSSLISKSRLLHLKNLLHAPGITKNLIFASKFTKGNGVYLEFHPTRCFDKDSQSHRILLQGIG